MKILQVLPELNAGGVERTTLEIADALNTAGHQAHIASQGGRMEAELIALGGISHILPLKSKSPLKLRTNTQSLINLIKSEKIDLVHARSRAPAWAAAAAARATNVPFITTYHGIYNAKSGLKRRYNAVMTKGDLVIANSNFTKTHIIQEHGTEADKIIVIPRGVDMHSFDPAKINAADIAQIKNQWGISKKNSIILLPGRLTRWKGQLLAISALEQLHKLGHTADLVLMGDAQGRDQYVEQIKAHAISCGVENHVIIADHSTKMPAALMAADIVLSASTDPEAFGRVSAEAQAMGRFSVASAHGGSLEIIEDGKGGLLFKPQHVNDLCAALKTGLETIRSQTKAQKIALQKHQRRRIEDKFSARALQAATLAVYAQALTTKV